MPQSNSSFNEELSYNYNVLKKSTDIEITTPWQRKVDHEIWWKEKKLQLVLNNSNKKSSNPRKTLLTEQEKILLVKVDQWVRCYSRLKEGRFYITWQNPWNSKNCWYINETCLVWERRTVLKVLKERKIAAFWD